MLGMITSRSVQSVSTRACSTVATLLLTVGLLLGAGQTQARAAGALSLVPTITGLAVQDGQLLASGFISAINNGQVVTSTFNNVPVTLGATPTGGTCPVLNLQLGAINLDLLGLVVTTSPICLDITAHQGGGLLGNLLCSVANLLNQGLSLDQILAGLTGTQLNTLLSGLTQVLNQTLNTLNHATLTSVTQQAGACDILNLTLGPLDLNLLGLEVNLSNCTNGAVTVSITGQTGQNDLLGNLLCGLANALNGGLSLQQIISQLLAGL